MIRVVTIDDCHQLAAVRNGMELWNNAGTKIGDILHVAIT